MYQFSPQIPCSSIKKSQWKFIMKLNEGEPKLHLEKYTYAYGMADQFLV